ncbi:MAG: LytR family transcriptional regulator [Actinomycetota bacterium]|nr:MAG: LytR family transcriptional regulator [Actinomycetota bacterium]
MSFDYRDGNDDDYEGGEDSYPGRSDDPGEDEDGYPVGDDYSRLESGKRDRSGKRKNKDFDDDFFKDEDFEFADYSGDNVEEEGYRSKRIREKRKRRKLIYTSFAIFIIIVIIAAAIVFGYRYIRNRFFAPVEITEEERITVPESLELGQDINIIIAGAGEDLLEPDVNSIIFTSYYSASGETRSLCMPTKTLMDVPGIGAELIGRSVEIGGMDLLSLTLEKGLGMDMEIDYYLLMDVEGIVNKLGGIELSLDQALAIKDYTDGTIFSLEPGVNLLDGSETQNMLKYFSGIEKEVPVEDIKMQKKIIDTIIARIVGDDDEALTNNINLIKDYIDSDLSLEELLKLFSTFSKIEAGKNMVYTLGVSSTELEGEGIVYLPDVANLSTLFSKEQTQEEIVTGTERTITVIILNGVGTPGIASGLSDVLRAQVYESGKVKFNILEVGNADNFNYSESEIVVYSSNESIIMTAAGEIKEMLATGNITTREEEVVSSDIVIILGADYDPESTQDVVPIEVTGIVEMVILNGEGTAKLAATVQDILENHFNKDEKIIEVVETRDADNWGHTQTEIIIYADNEGIEAFAQQIQERLGVGVIKKSDNNIDDVDITVLVGSDYTSQ